MHARLADYAGRRDFDRTPEPRPDAANEDRDGPPRFVIHEHDTERHHFDLRLEIDGVLASWVVPRGPATDPRDHRLALRMEDHPLAYADFEGVIPEGEYGAGTIMVWDRGTYRNVTARDGERIGAERALEEGQLVVRLDGVKLHGSYTLQRTGSEDDEERWQLIKTKDDGADSGRRPASNEPHSVVSGRTLEAVADEEQETE